MVQARASPLCSPAERISLALTRLLKLAMVNCRSHSMQLGRVAIRRVWTSRPHTAITLWRPAGLPSYRVHVSYRPIRSPRRVRTFTAYRRVE